MDVGARTISKVLVIDDDARVRRNWVDECEADNRVALGAATLADAIDIACREKPELVVVDLYVPNRVGPTIVRRVRDHVPEAFFIAVSAYMTVEDAMQFMDAGADDCYQKPVSMRKLIRRVEECRRPAPVELDYVKSLSDVEWEYIVRTLDDCGGNKSQAAERLGITRRTLHRKVTENAPGKLHAEPARRRRSTSALTSHEAHELHNAMMLIHEAFEITDDAERRTTLAREALTISRHCADAYVLLAEAAEDRATKIELARKGVEAGERALRPAALVDDVGRFWRILETRPYMRARCALAHWLCKAGMHADAIEHYREMLALDPDDHLAVRYRLAACLELINRKPELVELIGQHKDDLCATWACWSRSPSRAR